MRPPLLLCAALFAAAACSDGQKVEGFPDSFVGVGLELKMAGDEAVVVRTIEGGSADQAGLVPDDRVLAVDGIPTRGMTLGDVVMRIRGRPDTQVTLTVMRKKQRMIMVLKRRKMAKSGEDYTQSK